MQNIFSRVALALSLGVAALAAALFSPAAFAQDVTITKTAPLGAAPGANLTYGIEVKALGSGASAQNVTWSDVLPAGTTFVSATQTSEPAFRLSRPAVGMAGTVSGTISSLVPNRRQRCRAWWIQSAQYVGV